jgi:hypothetical protein
VKNVFRTIEDNESGNLAENIKKNFLLSDVLARYVPFSLMYDLLSGIRLFFSQTDILAR